MPGTFYILPEAYDVDAETFSVVRYELMEETATTMTSRDDVTPANEVLPFRLESVRRDDSSFDVRLVVTETLDREVRRHRLQLYNYIFSTSIHYCCCDVFPV